MRNIFKWNSKFIPICRKLDLHEHLIANNHRGLSELWSKVKEQEDITGFIFAISSVPVSIFVYGIYPHGGTIF